jgi:hypothetical protein
MFHAFIPPLQCNEADKYIKKVIPEIMKQLFDSKQEFLRRWQSDAAGVIREHIEKRTGRKVYLDGDSHTVRVEIEGSGFIAVSGVVDAARELRDTINEARAGFRVAMSTVFRDSELCIKIY